MFLNECPDCWASLFFLLRLFFVKCGLLFTYADVDVNIKYLLIPHVLVDHSRVRLQRGDKDYINASLVNVPSADRSYILTQVWFIYLFLVYLILTHDL